MKSENTSTWRRIRGAVSDFFTQHITSAQPKVPRVRSRRACRALRTGALVLWLVFPLLCFLFSEYICFIRPSDGFFSSAALEHIAALISKNTAVVILDLVLLYAASLVITLVFGRLWVSCAVLGVASFCLSTTSFFKFQVTGEYFYPLDIRQAGNTNLLVDYINTNVPALVVLLGVLILLAVAFLAFTRMSIAIRPMLRIPVGIAVAMSLLFTYSTPDGAARLAESAAMSFDELANGTACNSENGFFGALLLGILSEAASTPDEYSQKTVYDIMSRYTEKDAEEDFSKPNIVVILQESLWDIRDLPGCTFSEDVLMHYDSITARDGVYSGKMLSPTFGGGTVHPEFELLTGLTSAYLPSGSIPYQFIDSEFDAYPSMLKKLGYETLAVHPYLSSFYEREEKYPLLGFDNTYFYEDLREIDALSLETCGQFVSDDSFAQCVEYFLEQSTEPLFLFGISMEGHQPYEDKYSEHELRLSVESDALDDELLNILTQYSQCVADADAEIGRLAAYIDAFEEDTILIVFGDHAPSLGSDKAVYRATGFISDEGLTASDTQLLLETPFLIMSNFDMHESSLLTEGNDNSISPYNLLNAALELSGAPETRLMAFLKDYAAHCPAYTPKLEALGEGAEEFTRAHEFISYDRIRGMGYSHSN